MDGSAGEGKQLRFAEMQRSAVKSRAIKGGLERLKWLGR